MRRVHHFLRNQVGATTAEYAVVISLIVAALVLATDGVRLATHSAFHRAGIVLGGSPDGDAYGYSPAQPADDAPTNPSPPPFSIASMPPTHALAWGVLLMAIAVVGHSRYRQRRAKRAVQEIHSSSEQATEIASNPNFRKRQEIQRVLLRHFDDALQSRIEVRHVMSRTARAVGPSALVNDLQELMEREGFHHLLVLQNDKLVGVISDRDIHGRRGRQAQHIMTANPLSVSPGTQLAQAISIMLHRRISCLPIVEQERVVGILTVTDMLMTLQCLMKLLERASAEGPQNGDSSCRMAAEMATVSMQN